jgi:hypothetical protein
LSSLDRGADRDGREIKGDPGFDLHGWAERQELAHLSVEFIAKVGPRRSGIDKTVSYGHKAA